MEMEMEMEVEMEASDGEMAKINDIKIRQAVGRQTKIHKKKRLKIWEREKNVPEERGEWYSFAILRVDSPIPLPIGQESGGLGGGGTKQAI